MSGFKKVACVTDIPDHQGRVFDVEGKPVAVFHIDGQCHAIANTCPHRGGPLGEGDLSGTVVTCPWHRWQFDVTTGVSPVNPAASVKKYECRVEGNDILVSIGFDVSLA